MNPARFRIRGSELEIELMSGGSRMYLWVGRRLSGINGRVGGYEHLGSLSAKPLIKLARAILKEAKLR